MARLTGATTTMRINVHFSTGNKRQQSNPMSLVSLVRACFIMDQVTSKTDLAIARAGRVLLCSFLLASRSVDGDDMASCYYKVRSGHI